MSNFHEYKIIDYYFQLRGQVSSEWIGFRYTEILLCCCTRTENTLSVIVLCMCTCVCVWFIGCYANVHWPIHWWLGSSPPKGYSGCQRSFQVKSTIIWCKSTTAWQLFECCKPLLSQILYWVGGQMGPAYESLQPQSAKIQYSRQS